MPWYGFKRKRHGYSLNHRAACDHCHRTFAAGAQQVKTCPMGDGHWLCLHCYDTVPHDQLEAVTR